MSQSGRVLYKKLLGSDYAAHNAAEDCQALKALLQHSSVDDIGSYCRTLDSVRGDVEYLDMRRNNCQSLAPLLQTKAITKNVAEKIAGSGLSYHHLQCVYQRNGAEGIEDIFKAKNASGKVRVTARRAVCNAVSSHFQTWLVCYCVYLGHVETGCLIVQWRFLASRT